MIRELNPGRWTRRTWCVVLIAYALTLTACMPSVEERQDEWTQCGRDVASDVIAQSDPDELSREEVKALIVRTIPQRCGDYPA